MDTIITIIMVGSVVLGTIGYIWGAIAAFQKSVTWGCVYIFFAPFGVIAFLAVTWRENYRPLILVLLAAVGGVVYILSY